MTPDHSTFTVHERLMIEATKPLVERATEGASDVLRRVDDLLAQVAQDAYTRGVRDGYVQAINEGRTESDRNP